MSGHDAAVSLYAEVPSRRARQVAGDLLVVLWVVLWVAVGRAVHAQVARLGEPGRTLEDAGRALEEGLRDAAEAVGRAPVVGDDLRAPLDSAGGAAATLARAGVDVQTGAGRAALLAGLAVAVWPVVVVAGAWVVHRWRTARRATVARRVLAEEGGVDLLALRALVRAPLGDLARIGPDAAAGWRRGDPDTVRALAALSLRDVGLRAPVPPGDRRSPR